MTQKDTTKKKQKVWWSGNFFEVHGPEDLEPRGGLNINPPPSDGRCDCCGRPLDELTPFGEAADSSKLHWGLALLGRILSPWLGRDGALLRKTFRPCGPYDEEAKKEAAEAAKRYEEDGYEGPLEWLVQKHGKERATQLWYSDMAHACIASSWECSDCIGLGTNAYYERRDERNRREENQ